MKRALGLGCILLAFPALVQIRPVAHALAGQPGAYLVQQLANLTMMSPLHPDMRADERDLSPDQAKAIAVYLGSG